MTPISLQNVAKIFDGDVVAVSDFNLDITDGEFMVIVGPSGCGKTTTLRMIAGLEKATAGDIYIGDRHVNDLSAKDRNVAMVFQDYTLYPHMTVYQNLAFALKMRKLPTDQMRRRVAEAAGLLGIEKLLKRKPAALSGGQRQRVALARAIVRQPRAFLFDEPLSNLDAGLRRAMRIELKDLHRRLQTTTVYVTHDQAEAMSLGDRLAVMLDGAIQQTAEPAQVYDRPANRFVAGFVGTPPMNFFKGRLEFGGGALKFVIDGEAVVIPLNLRALLQEHHGREMVLGVRPEDISPAFLPGQAENSISATVEVVEPLGARTDLYMANRAGRKFTVRTDPHTPLNVGDAVKMHIDVEKAHIFELEGAGRNVTLPG
ncbi:MAG: sn-glycerol-3-phosphate ABC transporter ATP-binding protein UgpC [Phycisphaerales bacterium]|nr:MAG: sn-glycerol-3-phosphate ABC transporter ATP-binding protein UgpC [Phycisphaerales bacterium]